MALPWVTCLLVISAALLHTADGYSNGAPSSACGDMRAIHGVPAKTTPPPYTVKASKTTYESHEEISVTISGNEVIAGFLLEAVSTDKSVHVGYFQTPDTTNFITLGCGEGNAVTNSRNLSLYTLTVIWQAPTQTVGNVVMAATVVKNMYTSWLNIKSTVLTEILPTLAPPFQPTAFPGQIGGPGNFPPGFCQTAEESFGLAPASTESFNVKWTYIPCTTPPEVEFDISADISDVGFGTSWIAIGFSKDEYMGDDSVVECVQLQTGQISIRASYNQPNTKNNIVIPAAYSGLTPIVATASNGKFHCRFRRAISVVGDFRIFDLSTRVYRLLVARGRAVQNGRKVPHSLQYKKSPVVSTKYFNFMESGHLRTLK